LNPLAAPHRSKGRKECHTAAGTETPVKRRTPQNTLAQDKANVLSDSTPRFLCRFRRFLPNFEKIFTFVEKIQILPSNFRVPIRSI